MNTTCFLANLESKEFKNQLKVLGNGTWHRRKFSLEHKNANVDFYQHECGLPEQNRMQSQSSTMNNSQKFLSFRILIFIVLHLLKKKFIL